MKKRKEKGSILLVWQKFLSILKIDMWQKCFFGLGRLQTLQGRLWPGCKYTYKATCWCKFTAQKLFVYLFFPPKPTFIGDKKRVVIEMEAYILLWEGGCSITAMGKNLNPILYISKWEGKCYRFLGWVFGRHLSPMGLIGLILRWGFACGHGECGRARYGRLRRRRRAREGARG